MHQRTLPRFPTLGAFLAYLEERDELETVAAPVSMRLEVTELHRRVIAAGGPALRLTGALDRDGHRARLPVVTNLFGTTRRVAWGLGTEPENLVELGELLAWLRSPQPPRNFGQARRLLPAARSALQARPKTVSRPRE